MKVAFLGPVGTFSHQAAYYRFGPSVEYYECQTIRDTFNAISSTISLAVIPQENSLYGNVTETYDLLRSPEAGQSKFVVGEVILPVKHCLLVARGVQVQQIGRILSHEQALGQCGRFISKHLPHAKLVKTASTAAAAQAVLSDPQPSDCAAICSKLCATVFDGLDILYEGIQDEMMNSTRFYIIAAHPDIDLPSPVEAPHKCALVRISCKLPETSSKESPSGNITQLLTALGLYVTRLDRRPSLHPMPFHDVYFVELKEGNRTEGIRNGDRSWLTEVEEGIQHVIEIGAEAQLLGSW